MASSETRLGQDMTHPEMTNQEKIQALFNHLMSFRESQKIMAEEMGRALAYSVAHGVWPRRPTKHFEKRVLSWMESEFGPAGRDTP